MTNQHRIAFTVTDEHGETEYSIAIGVDSAILSNPDIRKDAIDSALRLLQRRIALDFAPDGRWSAPRSTYNPNPLRN